MSADYAEMSSARLSKLHRPMTNTHDEFASTEPPCTRNRPRQSLSDRINGTPRLRMAINHLTLMFPPQVAKNGHPSNTHHRLYGQQIKTAGACQEGNEQRGKTRGWQRRFRRWQQCLRQPNSFSRPRLVTAVDSGRLVAAKRRKIRT
jgi:hypothetical protein